jgi:hypothetical protein
MTLFKDNSYKTAIVRTQPSSPMRYLDKKDLLKGETKLDYGCGRGFDAEWFNMDKFDPHFSPEKPTKTYDLITCNYVLNVIKEPKDRINVLENICKLLSNEGKAYITVRRDLKKDTKSQWRVFLTLPVVYKEKNFCIYELNKTSLSFVKPEVKE